MLKKEYNFNDLVEIMNTLRSENGCPWDKEQTHDSLKKYLIEETYEVLEAIDLEDKNKISEELGDLLLQIVFHSNIGESNNEFNITDVISGICEKMISRHPHIFGDDKCESSKEVLAKWEDIKKKEKGISSHTEVLKNVPSNLPALMRSYKVQSKAALVGFDWDDMKDVFRKIYEEIQELEEAYTSTNKEHISEEMGDVFFAIVNLSRFLEVHPELALTNTTEKFIRRFQYIETASIKQGKKLEDMTLKEMDNLWEESKIKLKNPSN